MPSPGAASLLLQAETAIAIIEASVSTASEVRTGARRAYPPGAPERIAGGRAGETRLGEGLAFIGGRFPDWDSGGGHRAGRAGCARPADSVLAAGRAGVRILAAVSAEGGRPAARHARPAGMARGPARAAGRGRRSTDRSPAAARRN